MARLLTNEDDPGRPTTTTTRAPSVPTARRHSMRQTQRAMPTPFTLGKKPKFSIHIGVGSGLINAGKDDTGLLFPYHMILINKRELKFLYR